MDRVAPSNKFVADSGGSMVFTVPLNATKEIVTLFKLLETDDDVKDIKFDERTGLYQSDEEPLLR